MAPLASSSFLAPLLLLLSLLAAVAAASSSSSSSPSKKFVFLVVREDCVETFFTRFDLLNVDCLKASISKALGFAIILGACVVKLPTVLKIRARGSVDSISAYALYQELLSNILATVWNVLAGNPFSSYGETIIVSLGSLAVTVLVWQYKFPGAAHVVVVLVGLSALSAAAFWTPAEHMDTLQYTYSAVFSVSRVTQIVEVFQTSSMGANAFLTLFMNFAGSAARVFTSSQEVKNPVHFRIAAFNATLNGILLAQFIYYSTLGHGADAKKKQEAPKAPAKAAAAAAAAKPAPVKTPTSSGSTRSAREASPAATSPRSGSGLVQRKAAAGGK
jgi:mannose-P-dolichol utilization defect protein 1